MSASGSCAMACAAVCTSKPMAASCAIRSPSAMPGPLVDSANGDVNTSHVTELEPIKCDSNGFEFGGSRAMAEGVSGAPLLSVSGSVSVWRDASGGLLHSCNAVRSGASTCAAPRSTPTGGYAVGTAQGTIELLSASGAVERSLVASPGAAVRAICFDRQARYLWAAGEATKVVLFDLSDQARSTPRAALMVRSTTLVSNANDGLTV